MILFSIQLYMDEVTKTMPEALVAFATIVLNETLLYLELSVKVIPDEVFPLVLITFPVILFQVEVVLMDIPLLKLPRVVMLLFRIVSLFEVFRYIPGDFWVDLLP